MVNFLSVKFRIIVTVTCIFCCRALCIPLVHKILHPTQARFNSPPPRYRRQLNARGLPKGGREGRFKSSNWSGHYRHHNFIVAVFVVADVVQVIIFIDYHNYRYYDNYCCYFCCYCCLCYLNVAPVSGAPPIPLLASKSFLGFWPVPCSSS